MAMSFCLENDILSIGFTQRGGALTFARLKDGREFLRAAPLKAPFDILNQACFPMVPLCNRIGGNQFNFDGEAYYCCANSSIDPLYIHGDGWLSEWDVLRRSHQTAVLEFKQPANKLTPFAYIARQEITLEGNALKITLSVTNIGRKALPFGFGLHPYFPRSPAMTINFDSQGYWDNNDSNLPDIWVPSNGIMDFNLPRRLPGRLIDNCFAGWNHDVLMTWPEYDMAVSLRADNIFQYCQIFAPQDQPYFCFEPMSHKAGGLNEVNHPGFITLGPQETLSGNVSFNIHPNLHSAAR